jgi:hypothetical protein
MLQIAFRRPAVMTALVVFACMAVGAQEVPDLSGHWAVVPDDDAEGRTEMRSLGNEFSIVQTAKTLRRRAARPGGGGDGKLW